MDPDPGDPKTCGACGSGSPTLGTNINDERLVTLPSLLLSWQSPSSMIFSTSFCLDLNIIKKSIKALTQLPFFNPLYRKLLLNAVLWIFKYFFSDHTFLKFF
jgi:hypothetical protein